MTGIISHQIYEKIKNISKYPSELIDESEARELLQAFFDHSLIDTPFEDVKYAFSLLRKINLITDEPIKQINISDLISTLTFCFDVIYAKEGRRILFSSNDSGFKICAKPEKISVSFLNILFNLVELFDSTYCFISSQAANQKAIIKIELESYTNNEVNAVFDKLGNDYIYRLGGCVLITVCGNTVKAVISLPLSSSAEYPEYQIPDVEDLLFDRLSVIYSSLF